MGDKCKDLREIYEACFLKWFDEDFITGKDFGGKRFVPCEPQLADYHECLKLDPDKGKYLLNLEELKEKNK